MNFQSPYSAGNEVIKGVEPVASGFAGQPDDDMGDGSDVELTQAAEGEI